MSPSRSESFSFHRFAVFSQMVIKNFDRDKCFILASSVVYSTIISAIPFLAFIISLLTAFGAFDMAQASVLELFSQQFGSAAGMKLFSLVDGFVLNAGSLGVVGLLSFLITSVVLINRVWVTINQIYHTSLNRNQVGRFAQFITGLVITTLLMSAYFSVNAIMSDYLSQFFALGLFLKLLGIIGPWMIIFLAFFLLIFAVPNTKVNVRSALLGAAVGMISFQLINALFNDVVLRFMNYSIIYGSFATLLIGLVWMYLWWVIIFGAVEIAYVHQYRPDQRGHQGLPNPPAEQLASGIDILQTLSQHFREGKGAMSVRDLGLLLKIPDRTLYIYLDMLEQEGFVLKMERTGRHYLPARPLDDLMVGEVTRLIYGSSTFEPESWTPGERIAGRIYEEGAGILSQMSFSSLTDDQE